MNPLTNVKNINKLNEREAELGISSKSSWHQQYSDSAYIFIGGLPYDLSEGDIICVFSQYGEIVNINLVRDKKSGKSKGFCFIAYEDQRSTILAVDNLNGIKLLGRTLRVDHVQEYRKPKEDENEDDITKRLRQEGCAPRTPSPSPSESENEESAVHHKHKDSAARKAKKKAKKGKKKRKKEKTSASSDSDSEPHSRRDKKNLPVVKKEKSDSVVFKSEKHTQSSNGRGNDEHKRHRSAKELEHSNSNRGKDNRRGDRGGEGSSRYKEDGSIKKERNYTSYGESSRARGSTGIREERDRYDGHNQRGSDWKGRSRDYERDRQSDYRDRSRDYKADRSRDSGRDRDRQRDRDRR